MSKNLNSVSSGIEKILIGDAMVRFTKKDKFDLSSYIEVFPYGLVGGVDEFRSIFILKDASGNEALPVWLKPIDAGLVAVSMSGNMEGSTAHKVSLDLLNALGFKIVRAVFAELQDYRQYVEFHIVHTDKSLHIVKFNVEEAISLAIAAKAKFYAKADFIAESKSINQQVMTAKQNILSEENTQKYLM